MSAGFVITGTDTDVGKTIVAAMLTLALRGTYWKPIQSGIEEIDVQTVRRLTGLPDTHFMPEQYRLSRPLSPHRAAELDGVEIDVEQLTLFLNRNQVSERVILIESAGGLMVPITRHMLQIDMIKNWNMPVILVARTQLGTINHTLLSVEALKARGIPIHGLIFSGPDNPDTTRTISDFTGVKVLGRVPVLQSLTPAIFKEAFDQNFKQQDFA
ncbi:MAG: dethiobiotin synthase [Alphaproteobacteria bacterium]|nr:dethiobiotin synthase [Alphaproteobacteria bacterium]